MEYNAIKSYNEFNNFLADITNSNVQSEMHNYLHSMKAKIKVYKKDIEIYANQSAPPLTDSTLLSYEENIKFIDVKYFLWRSL
jgi:hypothetical protein